MKILAISDTHLLHKFLGGLPEADILIHAGDMLNYGKREELPGFVEWWNALDYREKIVVPGNHDWCFEKHEFWSREQFQKTRILIDAGCQIGKFKFWGTPWQPPFCGWAFNREPWERRMHFSKIPSDINVLISHAPPKGYRDALRGTSLGDEELNKALLSLGIPPIHICGHIHDGYGHQLREGGQSVYNVAICNERYKPINKPTLIEI